MAEPLRLHGVSKRYGVRGPWVLRGVDVELAPGSLVRVDGANGSGKSTLLALMAGIGRPTRGRVTGGGRRAYVPERLPAVLPFDVMGYLDRLGSVHGLHPDVARERATEWLERLGATAWARAPMSVLSKGTAQKVALAQALMADADVLVLDEAWTGLDAEARDVLDRSVDERLASGVTIVLVDHRRSGRADLGAEVFTIQGSTLVRAPRQPVPSAAAPAPGPHGGRGRSSPGDVVEIDFEDGAGRRTVRVPADGSDDALRDVLSRPGGHVRSVRTIGPVSLDDLARALGR